MVIQKLVRFRYFYIVSLDFQVQFNLYDFLHIFWRGVFHDEYVSWITVWDYKETMVHEL